MSESSQTADRKLLELWAVHDLSPDAAEIEASRQFHLRYWLGLAEFAIARDHRQSCYGSLSANIRDLLSSYEEPFAAPPETVDTIRHDLAFLEGNVRAYRDLIDALRALAGNIRESEGPQECGSRAA